MYDWYNRYVTSPIYKMGSYFSTKSSGSNGKVVETIIKHEYQKLEPICYKQLPRISHMFLKVAAFSGFAAVVMSAYGSHGIFLSLYLIDFLCFLSVSLENHLVKVVKITRFIMKYYN